MLVGTTAFQSGAFLRHGADFIGSSLYVYAY